MKCTMFVFILGFSLFKYSGFCLSRVRLYITRNSTQTTVKCTKEPMQFLHQGTLPFSIDKVDSILNAISP
jgi:hypothetical protein